MLGGISLIAVFILLLLHWSKVEMHRSPPAIEHYNWGDLSRSYRESAKSRHFRDINAHRISRPFEALPLRLAKHAESYLEAPRGTFVGAAAQFVRAPETEGWVVKRGAITCLIQAPRGGLVCDSTKSFLKKGIVLGSFDPPTASSGALKNFSVLGVAPDWAEIASLTVGHISHYVTIKDNIYTLRANAPILLDRLIGSHSEGHNTLPCSSSCMRAGN